MNSKIKSNSKYYIKNIKKNLICNYSLKKVFLLDLKQRVYDFTILNPKATIIDIENQFGSASEISNSFGTIITEELRKKARLYKILIIIAFIVCVVLIALLTILIIEFGSETIISDPY